MKKIIISILISFIFIGCAAKVEKAERKAIKVTNNTKEENSIKKNNAIKQYIDGLIKSVKGNSAAAILDFQDALENDPKAAIYYSIAKEYYKLNKISNAIQNINKALEIDTTNTDYYLFAGQLYSLSGNYDYAIETYETAVRLDSTNYKALFALGELYSANKPQKALKAYEKVLDLIGPEWSVLVSIAELNERLGNVEKTITTVNELLKLNPSNLDLRKLLIEAYIKNKQYDKALELTEDALQSFPEDNNLIEYKANCLVKMDNWKDGYEWYKKLLSSKDVEFDNKMRIITGFLDESQRDSTLIDYAEQLLISLEKDSVSWQTKVYLAEIYVSKNNINLAIKFFSEACNLAQWNDQLWIRYGSFLFDNKKYKEAIDEMGKAVRLFPTNYLINLLLAYSYSQLQDHSNASDYFEKCLNLRENDVTVLNGLAFTKYSNGEVDTALVLLNRALKIDPNNAQVYGMIGMIYSKKEMYSESDSAYEKAVSLDPEDPLLLNNYAYSLSERGLQLQRCLEMAKKAIEKVPDNSSYLDTIGWVYYMLNDYEKAKEFVQKSLDIEPDNATVLDHLGDIYYKLGNKIKAKEYWEKAYSLDKTIKNLEQKINKGEL